MVEMILLSESDFFRINAKRLSFETLLRNWLRVSSTECLTIPAGFVKCFLQFGEKIPVRCRKILDGKLKFQTTKLRAHMMSNQYIVPTKGQTNEPAQEQCRSFLLFTSIFF